MEGEAPLRSIREWRATAPGTLHMFRHVNRTIAMDQIGRVRNELDG
jgi:hypothetical protein